MKASSLQMILHKHVTWKFYSTIVSVSGSLGGNTLVVVVATNVPCLMKELKYQQQQQQQKCSFSSNTDVKHNTIDNNNYNKFASCSTDYNESKWGIPWKVCKFSQLNVCNIHFCFQLSMCVEQILIGMIYRGD